MKRPPKIPIVSDFHAGTFLLRDRRRLTSEERTSVSNAYADYLQPKLDQVRPGTQWCGNVRSEHDKYLERMATSGQSPQDFEVKNPFEVEDDSSLNPELGLLTFGVYTVNDRLDLTLCGVFSLYNVEIEKQTLNLIEISAFPCPAYETSEGVSPPGGNTVIMEALLENDLQVDAVSNQILDLVAWRFPTRGGRAWVEEDGSLCSPVQHLVNRAHVLRLRSKDGRHVPQEIRRP